MTSYPVAAERDCTYGFVMGNHATVPDFDAVSWTALDTAGLPVEGSVQINQNARALRPNRANGFRNLRYTDIINDGKLSAPTLSLNIPATTVTLDHWLYGIFQSVTEAATTPYVKDFVFPAASAVPDFSANAGWYATFVKSMVGSLNDTVIMSAVPTSLTLSCYPDQNDGNLRVAADFIGRFYQDGQTYSGTMTMPASVTSWNIGDLKTTTLGGTNVLLYGFTFTITNGLKPIPVPGYSASGKSTQSYTCNFFNCTGSIDVLYDATVKELMATQDATEQKALVIAWGSGADPITTSGDLLFKAYIQANNFEIQGDEECKRRINFDCIEQSAAEAFEVHMANAVDRAW